MAKLRKVVVMDPRNNRDSAWVVRARYTPKVVLSPCLRDWAQGTETRSPHDDENWGR